MYTVSPGYLVSVKTSLRGGVKHSRIDLRDDKRDDGSEEKEWKTTKTVANRREFRKATLLRAKIAGMVSGKCLLTPFGLLCPEARWPEVRQAQTEAQALVDDFNRKAQFTQIGLYVMPGRIASNDVEAASAIAREMRELAAQMKRSIKAGDVKGIRDAAALAIRMGQMLSEADQEKVNSAVKAARDGARKIAKLVEKDGKALETILPQIKLGPISKMRFAFLDVDNADEHTEVVSLPKASAKRSSQLDVDGDEQS